jgi:enoyl-[acyl-carrier-protein] reductase (NADH)
MSHKGLDGQTACVIGGASGMGEAVAELFVRSALYLSCKDSSGITGTVQVVDGGYITVAEWETEGRTRFMED